jgi:pyrroline-5-carboxylate reductase
MNKVIGIIGWGNMGSVIGYQLKSKYAILAFDKDSSKTKNISDVNVADNTEDLVNRVDVVILAIKPQDFDTVLVQIEKYVKGKLIISIAAGISTGYIENQLGQTRIIRVMPNLPVKVKKGMICLCKGKFAADEDLNFAQDIFNSLGQTILIEESMMDAATAISGSGPGYFYDLIQEREETTWGDYASKEFIPALSSVAQTIGFTQDQARILAVATAEGSIALLKETGLSPGVLRQQVTSKGGTTEAGLRALHSTHSLGEAVKAALKRAGELSLK